MVCKSIEKININFKIIDINEIVSDIVKLSKFSDVKVLKFLVILKQIM